MFGSDHPSLPKLFNTLLRFILRRKTPLRHHFLLFHFFLLQVSPTAYSTGFRQLLQLFTSFRQTPTTQNSQNPSLLKTYPENPIIKPTQRSSNSQKWCQGCVLCHQQALAHQQALTPPLPPPPPPPPPSSPPEEVEEVENEGEENLGPPRIEFQQEGKIFVGNLPNWVKKNEVAEFFRQFAPIKNVILIKGHDSTQRNAGFGFVLYGGSTAAKSAMKAVEFDGVEFHGRVLAVKLDDGKRSKEKTEERARWIQGYDCGGVNDYPSEWHEERERELSKGLQEGFGGRARELAGGRDGF